ncbi:MAG: hypothetical protein HY069_01615 [Chlamydiia bacterium]|nr:hypothetical protein [Chlamydiia bacterium]
MSRILFCLLLPFSLFSHSFKERLVQAKNGDFFVFEANKITTLVAIRSVSDQTLVIEEISIPSQNLTLPISWTDWVKKRAPGHTSWAVIEMDLTNGQVLECYSFSRSTWMQLSTEENLFSTLLSLPLQPINKDNRKRIGPPPINGENDYRKIWEPPLMLEGKKEEGSSLDAFEATWPTDGSEMGGKKVTLYFDHAHRFPFPFWISIDGSHTNAQVKTVDAGHNFTSCYRTFPRRVPEFLGSPKKTKTGLLFNLKSPRYYKEFELYAIDVTNEKHEITPVCFSHIEQKEEWLTIGVENEELENSLQKEHRYHWLLVPVGYSESYTETSKSFIWR